MANRPNLPVRNRRYVYDRVWAAWMRIKEDGIVTSYELVEMDELLAGNCRFADAVATNHAVAQAMPRATDPEYIGDLVAMNRAAMSQLPDAA